MIEIHDSDFKLSENELSAFEKKYKIKIPFEYRAFLLQHNGGYPEQTDFQMVNKQTGDLEWGSVVGFLGIQTLQTNSLEYVLRTFKNRIPPDLFPVARDPGGNFICISISRDDFGVVLFWDHEFESNEGQKPSRDNVYFIANNFGEFLTKLAN